MNVNGAQRWRVGRPKRLVASSTSYPPQPYPQISVRRLRP